MKQNDNEVLALPCECWRWIPGFEGIAQVSTSGQVKTVDRWVTYADGRKYFYKGRILKQHRNEDGYLFVNLSRNGKRRHFKVHRLVAEAFIPNPENKPQIHHRNEQKDMNFVENLSWATAKENVNYGTRNKRIADSNLNSGRSKAVQAVNPDTGKVVKEFPSVKEAGRNGFDRAHIWSCCQGKRRRHRGFEWRFKES